MISEAAVMLGAKTFSLLGAATLGGYLVSQAGRKKQTHAIERDWLANELDFDCLHQDGSTVILKNDQVFRVYKLRGISYETAALAQQETLAGQRSNLLHQYIKAGMSLRFFGVKRLKSVSEPSNWPSVTLQEIGDAEQRIYEKAYALNWYLVVQAPIYTLLENKCRELVSALSDYQPLLLERPEEESKPCELTSFLNYLVCGEFHKALPAQSNNISSNLPFADLEISKDGLIATHVPTPHYSRVIGIRQWPESINGSLIPKILSLPAEIEVLQISNVLDSDRALAGYTRSSREQSSMAMNNSTKVIEMATLMEQLVADKVTLFETQFQVTVRATSQDELNTYLDQIKDILNRARVQYSVETVGAGASWFNRIPGNEGLLRPLRITNINLSTLWSFHYSPEGMTKGPFGAQPVRYYKTTTGLPYAFQFHTSDAPQSPGNFLMFAPTGGGKSTTIMHLLGGMSKYRGHRSYIFDSKNGAKYMVKAMGGDYYSFDDLQLNPLDTDLTQKTNLHHARLILRAMLADFYNPEMDDVLRQALEMACVMEEGERTFDNLFQAAFPANSDLRKGFARWVNFKGREGQYAHVFNAPCDGLSSFLTESHLIGINMNEALTDPLLGPAVVAHISNAIATAARNNGSFSIFVDEAANLLQNPGFRSIVLEMYREYRKLDGHVGLAFQDPEALLKFKDHDGILGNTQLLVFLPNTQVSMKSLEPFNLSSEQIAFIKGNSEIRGGRKALIVKRDEARGLNESVILDVDLSDYGKALRFYKAGNGPNRELEEHIKQWGPDAWLAKL